MAHPKETKRSGGKLWHLEDQNLSLVEANALRKHLSKTEDKQAKRVKVGRKYQVWWAK